MDVENNSSRAEMSLIDSRPSETIVYNVVQRDITRYDTRVPVHPSTCRLDPRFARRGCCGRSHRVYAVDVATAASARRNRDDFRP